MKNTVGAPDWSTVPAPHDDGATRHLIGARMASIPLQATTGETVDLFSLRGRTIVYAYPRTGRPGVENPEGWDMIPGDVPRACGKDAGRRDPPERIDGAPIDPIAIQHSNS